jgi:ABC-type sugar transport system substrate-binding protein
MLRQPSRVSSTILMIVLALFVVACGGQGSSSTGNGSSSRSNSSSSALKIVVVPKTIGNNYWDTVQAGAQCAASKQANVKIVWDGTISDLVLQNPFKMGYDSVKALVNQLRNNVKATNEDTGVTFVSQANLSDPKIKAALTPTCANQAS